MMHELEIVFVNKTSINSDLQAQLVWMLWVLMEAAKIIKELLSLKCLWLEAQSIHDIMHLHVWPSLTERFIYDDHDCAQKT